MKLLIFMLFIFLFNACASNAKKTEDNNNIKTITINDINPKSGSILGNEEINIEGNGFSSSCFVYFNNKNADILS